LRLSIRHYFLSSFNSGFNFYLLFGLEVGNLGLCLLKGLGAGLELGFKLLYLKPGGP
jgi:hypothetical protein